MKPFIILGGAGYVGIQLVNALLEQGCEKIIVVSRNTAKRILFRDDRVQVVKSIYDVKTKAVVVNLAFANTSDYATIKISTLSLVNSIKEYHARVGAHFIVHISTIVLSEGRIGFGSVSKQDAYTYSKSLQENLFVSSFKSSELAIVRSGNILSENSPWLLKLASKLINEEPLKFEGAMAPSNATSLEFLVRTILDLGIREENGRFNCSELSQHNWDTFVDFLADKLSISNIQEFDEAITKPQSTLEILKKSAVQFGIALNTSPWHGDKINRAVGLKWVPVPKDNIRRSAKFKTVSKTDIVMKTGKDFKLFCDSRRVTSDFEADYTLEDMKVTLERGLIGMGFL